MATFNNVVLVGRLASDPELRYASSGAPICSFRVATSRRLTNEAGESVKEVTFIDVDVWRRMAEICAQFLKKGREILVMGTLRQSPSVGANTQEPRSTLKIVARDIQFLWPNKESKDVREDDPAESSDE